MRTARFRYLFPAAWLGLLLLLALLVARSLIAPIANDGDTLTDETTAALPPPIRQHPALLATHAYADSVWRASLSSLSPFDLNAVTPAQLSAMGIPASTAARIVARREKWGCYKHPAQLNRVWGIPPGAAAVIAPYARVSSPKSRASYYARPSTLFPFDPNTIPFDKLLQLGFSRRAAEMIDKYRAKGGTFRKKEDFKKLYCVDSAAYATLAPYIRMPKAHGERNTPFFSPADSLFTFNPNTSTKEELRRLGFSQRAAEMIDKYRAKGEAFRKKEDFKKLYCVDSAAYATLAPYIRMPKARREKNTPFFSPADSLFTFNPNTSTKEELRRLGFSQRAAEMIDKYRAKGGAFRKKEDFKKLYCVDSATYRVLEEYITVR